FFFRAEDGIRDRNVTGVQTCALPIFVVGRWGGAPESTDQPERSVYADWFTVMGLSELARATGERHWLEAARPVLERSRADHLAGTAPTPPYEIPAGHEAYGPRMILTNTLLVHAQAAEA